MDFVIAWAWPNAIHDGNGTAAFFITDRASLDQRQALSEIVTGNAVGKDLSLFLQPHIQPYTNQSLSLLRSSSMALIVISVCLGFLMLLCKDLQIRSHF